uniref:Uncharacterized protein n=1 Tax=Eutreptiella gymnastica TaxID=73025 RepID=A0A7S4FXI3_9EUGL
MERGGGGWHEAMVSVCLPLAAPIGPSPLHTPTLCGSERVLVVTTEPPDDSCCLMTVARAVEGGGSGWWGRAGYGGLADRACAPPPVHHADRRGVTFGANSNLMAQVQLGRGALPFQRRATSAERGRRGSRTRPRPGGHPPPPTESPPKQV